MKEYFAKLKYLFRWRDLAFTLVLFSLILIVAFARADDMMQVSFGETALDVTTNRYGLNVPYDMIASVEIGQVDKNDKILEGKGDIALRTGHFVSEAWGEYYGCIDLQTTTCIVIELDDGRIFVFSHKSDETVAEEFARLQGYLK